MFTNYFDQQDSNFNMRNVYFESVFQKLDIVMENAFEIISRVRENFISLPQSRTRRNLGNLLSAKRIYILFCGGVLMLEVSKYFNESCFRDMSFW